MSYTERKTNEYVCQHINKFTGRQELSLSTVASYHGSAMFVVMIRHRGSYYKEQWMVGVAVEDCVNHGRTTSMYEQASRCHDHCYTHRGDRGRRAVIAADASVPMTPGRQGY